VTVLRQRRSRLEAKTRSNRAALAVESRCARSSIGSIERVRSFDRVIDLNQVVPKLNSTPAQRVAAYSLRGNNLRSIRRSLGRLDSMERIDNLETLKEIVLKLEEIARRKQA
jgi:Tfp pilus assembly ATPase PilU